MRLSGPSPLDDLERPRRRAAHSAVSISISDAAGAGATGTTIGIRGTVYCRQIAQTAASTATEPSTNIRTSTATGYLIRCGARASVTLRFFRATLLRSP